MYTRHRNVIKKKINKELKLQFGTHFAFGADETAHVFNNSQDWQVDLLTECDFLRTSIKEISYSYNRVAEKREIYTYNQIFKVDLSHCLHWCTAWISYHLELNHTGVHSSCVIISDVRQQFQLEQAEHRQLWRMLATKGERTSKVLVGT